MTDLPTLLSSLAPEVVPGEFVFVTGPLPEGAAALATVVEAEGPSSVIRRADADAGGLDHDGVFAWITCSVHSSPQAVGMTAAISTALAAAGISCNVIAGFHHDHLLVPVDRLDDALGVLSSLPGPRR